MYPFAGLLTDLNPNSEVKSRVALLKAMVAYGLV